MKLMTLAALLVGFALGLMLFMLARPAPLAIGVFLGLGLGAAALGMLIFARVVLGDLKRRRAL